MGKWEIVNAIKCRLVSFLFKNDPFFSSILLFLTAQTYAARHIDTMS